MTKKFQRVIVTRAKCARCEGKREITTTSLGTIRCPDCTRAAVRKVSAKSLRELLTASEARRREQLAISTSITPETFKLPNIPNPLLTTDRILERWGCDGSGLPSENPDSYRQSRPPPLDPATYTEVERIINASPKRVRDFAYSWWRSYNPQHAVTKLRISRRSLGRLRIDVLHAFKAKFLTSRHTDLVALARFMPES